MTEIKPGMGNVTEEEKMAARSRVHDKDRDDIVKGIKKIIASNKKGDKNMFRILRCIFKELNDGYMIKMEVEKFLDGKNVGTRWIKGYLTDKTKDTIEASIRSITQKVLNDNRDGSSFTIPHIIERQFQEAPSDLDLEKLWDTSDKG